MKLHLAIEKLRGVLRRQHKAIANEAAYVLERQKSVGINFTREPAESRTASGPVTSHPRKRWRETW